MISLSFDGFVLAGTDISGVKWSDRREVTRPSGRPLGQELGHPHTAGSRIGSKNIPKKVPGVVIVLPL